MSGETAKASAAVRVRLESLVERYGLCGNVTAKTSLRSVIALARISEKSTSANPLVWKGGARRADTCGEFPHCSFCSPLPRFPFSFLSRSGTRRSPPFKDHVNMWLAGPSFSVGNPALRLAGRAPLTRCDRITPTLGGWEMRLS